MNEIIENLRDFLICLCTLKSSYVCDITGGNFCVSTNSDFASENWAFYDPRHKELSSEIIQNAKKFFKELNLNFILPVLNEKFDLEILKREGLNYAGNLTGMSFNVLKKIEIETAIKTENKLKIRVSSSDDNTDEWAETAWRGFGGESAPENFLKISRDMGASKYLKLFAAYSGDTSVGTFLLCEDKINAGVYYFAVKPEFRRKKIAHAMMNAIINIALECGKNKIVLQATPAGVPFYKNFGFDEIFNIPVFTNAENFDDVF